MQQLTEECGDDDLRDLLLEAYCTSFESHLERMRKALSRKDVYTCREIVREWQEDRWAIGLPIGPYVEVSGAGVVLDVDEVYPVMRRWWRMCRGDVVYLREKLKKREEFCDVCRNGVTGRGVAVYL